MEEKENKKEEMKWWGENMAPKSNCSGDNCVEHTLLLRLYSYPLYLFTYFMCLHAWIFADIYTLHDIVSPISVIILVPTIVK